jgi:DNA-binding NtrC family response regulator
MVASDILRESGFDTFHASDAEDAVGVLGAHPEIGLLLTDAALGGPADGLALARRVSQDRPDMQLVVTSADDGIPAAMPHGAQLLRKPYASGELRTLVGADASLEDA